MRLFRLVVLALLCLGLVVPAVAANLQVTVVFKSATLPANAAAIVQAAGGSIVSTVPELGVAVVSGPAAMLDKLNSNGAVSAASPTLEVSLPNDKIFGQELPDSIDISKATYYNLYGWDIKQMTNDGASWNISTGSHNTVVGIVDTGVSQNHSALKANLLGGKNFYPDGPNKTVVPTDIEDKNGHGSHVAGSIAGNGKILGIGPDLGFRMYRVFGASGGTNTTRIAAAMVQAINDGVDVISMSIGGYDEMAIGYWQDPTGEDPTVYRFKDIADFQAYRRAVQYALKAGVPVVVAAANEGMDIGNPAAVTAALNVMYGEQGYTFQGASREVAGTLPGVLTVAATGPNSVFASYSNYGAGAIDISAPGGDFQRYPAPDYYLDMCLSSNKGTGYVWMAGTSMATPKTAAVVALVIDQLKAKGIRPMPSQVVNQVLNTAVDAGKVGYDPLFGKGIANAFNALSQ